MSGRNGLAVALAAALLAGCGSTGKTFPTNSTLIPDINIGLSPGNTISLEKIAYGAAGAALLYYVFDPLAPNWSIEEAKLADDTYRLSLKMKRFHTGGDGEAMMVMKRRATQLKVEQGFADYQILEYAEGIESSTPISQRFGEGVIRLVRAPGMAPR